MILTFLAILVLAVMVLAILTVVGLIINPSPQKLYYAPLTALVWLAIACTLFGIGYALMYITIWAYNHLHTLLI